MTDNFRLSAASPLTIEELFAAHDNAGAVAAIHAWCDEAAAMDCSHTTEDECRRCEVIKDCSLAVRSLLPEVPPVRGEDGVNDDRDL